MKIWKIILIYTLMLLNATACLADVPLVRVAILKDVNSFIVSARGSYKIYDLSTKELLVEGRRLKRSRVKIIDNGITIGKKYYKTKKLRIETNKDVTVYSRQKKGRFREAVDIRITDKKDFLVINRVGLESYVKGVLYHEVSDKWPIEATKAQAVATRTYALYKMDENKKELFDVTSDIYSQVYGGQTAERFRTDIATKYTKGQVMVYDNEIVPAFFHSNSGGYTEDANQVWGIDFPPLKGVESPFSAGAPNYNWTRNFQSKDIQSQLESKGVKVGMIKNISVAERTQSGRIRELIIEDRKGRKTRVSGKKFRDIIGPNKVKSNMYEIKMKGYYFDLAGKGWGHGVGMCQWGAYNMAKKRYNYDDILKYYYPGVEIKKVQTD